MTLHTQVAIVGPISNRDALDLAIRAVCTAAGEPGRAQTAKLDEPSSRFGKSDDVFWWSTTCGQGLPAWTGCTYRVDAPLYVEDEYETDEDWSDEPYFVAPACSVLIDWDTTYGYRGPNGMRRSDLHSVAIAYVCEELTRRGLGMHWFNEYDSTWHLGVEGLDTLSAAGLEADLRFRHTARPAIEASFGISQP